MPQLISGFPSAISALPQGTLSAHGFLRRHMDSINPTTHAPYLSVAKTLHFHTQSLLHLRAGHRKASSSSLKGHLPLFFFHVFDDIRAGEICWVGRIFSLCHLRIFRTAKHALKSYTTLQLSKSVLYICHFQTSTIYGMYNNKWTFLGINTFKNV